MPRGLMGMYFRTVRGETRVPSFTNSSLAIRSSPQSGFSVAILRISARSSPESGGRPGRDLNRHSSLHPARCHRIIVAGRTTTRALRHSNSLASTAKLTRLAGSRRRGRAPRSRNNANWRRRNRFSAWTDFVDRKRSGTHRKRSSIRQMPILARVRMSSWCHSS